MRYMPCGEDRGSEGAERARTARFHRSGLAALTYLREAVCATYTEPFSEGVRNRLFIKRADGSPYTYSAFVGGRTTAIGQIDFGDPGAEAFHAKLLRRAVTNGYDGWMEDYGEYTPPDSVSSNGLDGRRFHNLYPVLYHRSGQRFADRQRRPIARFTRSGWTGVHRWTPIVWGGDPSTGFGFDGLRSSVTQALSMGTSGIGVWASDIGGFFTLTGDRLTPELLHRWIQFGVVSGVMRTKAEGIGVGLEDRPQIWERPTISLWRRYAKLRTQLYPYIAAAAAEYRRTGMPLMRHLALSFPTDSRATAREDQFMFGPHLLAAPVVRDGQRRKGVYLPRGRWIDLWRSARYERRGGGLDLRRARVLRGGRNVNLPAPLAELPLLVRAGAVLPLLSPDVDTLASYGRGGSAVRLRERAGRMRLLAFPRGRTTARMGARERLSSTEGRRVWRLGVRGTRKRRYSLQASLRTLRRPFAPVSVSLNGRVLPRRAWRYDRRTGSAADRLLAAVREPARAGLLGDAPAGRRRRIVELVVAAKPERPRRHGPALGQVLLFGLPAIGRKGPQAPEAADPLDHRSVLQEVGAVDVVTVAQEDVQAKPLVDPEVSREALAADRVPGHVGPTHALGVAAQVRLRGRRCHREGDVASMQEAELGDAVGEGRAADAPGVVTLLEEEPVQDQLTAPVEQFGKRQGPVRTLERIVLLHPHHRHALPCGGELVHRGGGALLALEQGGPRRVPLALADDRRTSDRRLRFLHTGKLPRLPRRPDPHHRAHVGQRDRGELTRPLGPGRQGRLERGLVGP